MNPILLQKSTAGISKLMVIPRQAEVAQGVLGRLRLRIFLTFRHYKGGRSSAIRTGRLYPRRNPWYSLSEAESTSGHMVLSGEPRKKSPVTPPGIDPWTFRLVAQCLNHYATPDPPQQERSAWIQQTPSCTWMVFSLSVTNLKVYNQIECSTCCYYACRTEHIHNHHHYHHPSWVRPW